MAKKILVVDDEESIATLISFHVEKEGMSADQAYNGLEAIEKIKNNDYDLVTLDLMIPGMDGLEVIKTLKQHQIDIPVIMITAKDDEIDKIVGLELGADDYITKPFSPKEIVARIKAILRRTTQIESQYFKNYQIGNITIYPERYEAEKDGEVISFTRKEFELLNFLASNRDKVLTREHLLNAVWNYDFMGDTRIVDVHISRLREKLEVNSKKPKYIKTIRGLGYKMEDPT